MFEQDVQKKQSFAEKLRWLIIGRLIASVFLLLTSALWLHGNLSVTYHSFWDGTLPIFVVVAIISALYSFALKYNDNYQTQAIIQLAFDIWITTWLVWTTGDVRSPYIVIYLVIISIASFFLGSNGALLTAVGCVLVFTSIALPASLGLMPRFAGVPETSFIKAIQTFGLNHAAFLIVGLLSQNSPPVNPVPMSR